MQFFRYFVVFLSLILFLFPEKGYSQTEDPFADDGQGAVEEDPFAEDPFAEDPFSTDGGATDDPFTDDPFATTGEDGSLSDDDSFGTDDPFGDGGAGNQGDNLFDGNNYKEKSTSQDVGFSKAVVDDIYQRTSIREKRLRGLTPINEIDVIWSKRYWRVLDMREKINQSFYYPEVPSGDFKNLINIIMDGVIDERSLSYSPITDDFTIEMTSQEVKAIGSSIDTILVTDPITLERSRKVVRNEFNRQDVKKYRIKEDWFIDRTRSKLDFRIIGICPIVEVIDEETEEVRGTKPLFWIYFPALRTTIVRHPSPNSLNDSDKKTYDELFLKRIFSTYIYKQSNVQDKIIQDYAQGIDALYESQMIQQQLVELENSLWHY